MSLPIYVADAFTKAPFAGNPAGVCLLTKDHNLDDKKMVIIASEMKHSETAFVYEIEEGVFSLRWFTPVTEVKLCGHATLATAHILYHEVGNKCPKLTFKTLSGDLIVSKASEDGKLSMDFPKNFCKEVKLPDDVVSSLEDSLGIPTNQIIRTSIDDVSAKLIVELSSFEPIKNAKPNSEKMMNIKFPFPVRGISISTRNLKESNLDGYDFASRYFAPWVGLPEDPVNGNIMTTMTKLRVVTMIMHSPINLLN
eukprot:TRINITY_DN4377_c0_g1_i2.p1 TRINITY_DN4377_c0_g1~~TRINITY_DN4377_c0_g1_i2.p1  ORF type:complete len:253 (-),score=46.76 TRINITY_DN4377_c0_g1_i2:192-950(-)